MSERRRLHLIWLGLGVLALGIIYVLGLSLLPFLLGGLFGVLLTPLVDRLEAGGTPRGWAAALITSVFLFFIAAALAVLLPMVASELGDLAGRLPELMTQLRQRLERWLGPYLLGILAPALGGGEMFQNLAEQASNALSALLDYGLTLLDLLLLIFLTPFVAFYLMRDWHGIIGAAQSLVPRRSQETVFAVFRDIQARLVAFLRGQALVAVALAVLHAGGLWLIGLNYYLLIGIGTGVMSFIPIIGNLIMFLIAIIMAVIQFGTWWQPLLVVAVFLVSQVLEDSVLVPNLVGHRIRLHPVWVIFALLVGAKLLGLVGMLLAMPLAAVGEVLGRLAAERYRDSRLYRES